MPQHSQAIGLLTLGGVAFAGYKLGGIKGLGISAALMCGLALVVMGDPVGNSSSSPSLRAVSDEEAAAAILRAAMAESLPMREGKRPAPSTDDGRKTFVQAVARRVRNDGIGLTLKQEQGLSGSLMVLGV